VSLIQDNQHESERTDEHVAQSIALRKALVNVHTELAAIICGSAYPAIKFPKGEKERLK
jgi:hypothetical protein